MAIKSTQSPSIEQDWKPLSCGGQCEDTGALGMAPSKLWGLQLLYLDGAGDALAPLSSGLLGETKGIDCPL